jgi:hypothetical protein
MTLPLQVAYLTGQSDPPSCGLTAEQVRFLRELPLPDEAKVYHNFPYDPRARPRREIPLAIASLNNVRQYLASQLPAFRERHREPVLALLARAERTVFLAGSCGIELLRKLRLGEDALRRVHVFAYGPVAGGVPECARVLVGSSGDRISRLFFPAPDVVVDAGHLGYLGDPELARHCRAFLAAVAG